MVVKDANYWKEYNQKRKERGYFQSNYLQRKGKVVKKDEEVVNNLEVVKNNSVVKSPEVVKSEVVKTETENILQPKKEVAKSLQPNPVVKNGSLQPTTILQPTEKGKDKNLQRSKWSFELFLEQFDYTNPNNLRGVYFSPKQIEAQKNLYREHEAKITVKNNPPIHLPSTNQNQVKTTINTLYE